MQVGDCLRPPYIPYLSVSKSLCTQYTIHNTQNTEHKPNDGRTDWMKREKKVSIVVHPSILLKVTPTAICAEPFVILYPSHRLFLFLPRQKKKRKKGKSYDMHTSHEAFFWGVCFEKNPKR